MDGSRDPILNGLNGPQSEAVRTVDGPLMVLAGAGSGKTRVITHRIAWMVRSGVDPRAILAVTFTNKAASEMRERVRRLTGRYDVVLTTFHSFCALVLRQDFPALGRSGDFTIYDEDDRKALLKQVMEREQVDLARLSVSHVRERIGRWKNALVTAEEALADSGGVDTEARLYARYDAALLEANACDFDDLLLQGVRVLRVPEVAARWRRQLTHFMVDEFQDTNPVQYGLIKLLSRDTQNLCVTGDPDQSIYSWRGADPGGFDRFLEDHAQAKVVRLEQNYRSTEHILTTASNVIAHNRNRLPKRLWTDTPGGEPVRVVGFQDEYEEARSIARAVHEWEAEGYSPKSIAVFYRTNDLSFALERAFVQEGVPYQVVGGLEFFARTEVKDVLAYLRFLANPSDVLAAARIVNVPPRGIGKKTLDTILATARRENRPIGEFLRHHASQADLPRRAKEALAAFGEQLRALDAELPLGRVSTLLQRIFDVTGYRDFWKSKASKAGSDDPERNLGQLVNLAVEHDEEGPDGGLTTFLERLALLSDVDRHDPGAERVSFMTLHTSKGLEFDAVVLLGVEDGLLPHAMSFADPDGREEERRLLHVGMTRARQRLVLTWARRRTRFGRTQPGLPSSFLNELGDDGVERYPDPSRATRGYDPEPGNSADRWDEDGFADAELEHHPLARLRTGSRVRHGDFGEGTVTRVSGRGRGLDRKVVVAFDDGGVRTLMLQYADLELVDDDAFA